MKPHEIEAAADLARVRLASRAQRRDMLRAEAGYLPAEVFLVTLEDGSAAIASAQHTPAEEDAGLDAVLAGMQRRRGDYDARVLAAFDALADADESAFVDFARRYGALELCDAHGLPAGHHPALAAGECWPAWCEDWRDRSRVLDVVRLEDWRRYARQVRAARNIAEAVHAGRSGGSGAWRELWPVLTQPWHRAPQVFDSPGWLGDAASERDFLAVVIDEWIQLSGLRPGFTWHERDLPVITFTGSMFAAVIRELMFEIARVTAARFCQGCGEIISGKYARKWCRECGKRAADRASKRRQRARKRN